MEKYGFFCLFALLTGCATQGSSGGGALAEGRYYIVHFNSEGKEINKPVKVDVPFNDVNYIIGGRCALVEGVQYIILKNEAGKEISKTNCK